VSLKQLFDLALGMERGSPNLPVGRAGRSVGVEVGSASKVIDGVGDEFGELDHMLAIPCRIST